MEDLAEIFANLDLSEFRRGFKLKGKELSYLRDKGLKVILGHAEDFIEKRLAPANPKNDGKQTPMRNHPVFIAQHATATCCRKCLEKWHGIRRGHKLNEEEKKYIVSVIGKWLERYL